MAKDYYKILEVKKTDSDNVIKKSYKKLALKYHPDKVSEEKKKEYEEKFKEINEAYSTLSDKEKRQRYDLGSASSFGSGSGSRGGSFFNMFEEIMRSGAFGGAFFGSEVPEEDLDLHFILTIEFNDAVFGCEKEISIRKDISCDYCDGTGSKDNDFDSCSKCNGNGQIKVEYHTPLGVASQIVECDNCYGKGNIPKHKCKKCNGIGIVNSVVKVKVKVPKGIDSEQTLRIKNEGNTSKMGHSGDLFLLIRVNPHKIFKRDEFDIYIDFPISFSQAALGAKINVPTLEGEVKVKIKKGIESGNVLRLKGKGIPFLDDPFFKGDEFVKILVKTPKKLSRAQIKLFKELEKLD